MSSSKDNKIQICRYCNYETAEMVAMMKHCLFQHADHSRANIKPANVFRSTFVFSCAWCADNCPRFNDLDKLRRHSRVAHPYNCQDCLKELITWQALVTHAKECVFARADMEYHLRMKSLESIP